VYFQHFPKIDYDVKGDGVKHSMTDITRRVRLTREAIFAYADFDFYDIKDGETPEYIAGEYYNDTELHWLVLMANNIVDYYNEWPMTVVALERMTAARYDNVDDIHHWEVTQGSGSSKIVLEYPNESATTIPTDAYPVTNAEYERLKNETKRRIRLIQKRFVPEIKKQFKSLIKA
jgi:hypothetical protein